MSTGAAFIAVPGGDTFANRYDIVTASSAATGPSSDGNLSLVSSNKLMSPSCIDRCHHENKGHFRNPVHVVRVCSSVHNGIRRRNNVHHALYSKQSDNDEGSHQQDIKGIEEKSTDDATLNDKVKDENSNTTSSSTSTPPEESTPPPAPTEGKDSISFQFFKVFSYMIQFLGLYFTFGLLLNILGYGYSFDFQNGFQVDTMQNMRNERQFQREMDRMTRESSQSYDARMNSGSTLGGSSFVDNVQVEE